MDKEEKKMINLEERLTEANKKVDSMLDDIWAQAESNLKKLESEYYKQMSEEKKKD